MAKGRRLTISLSERYLGSYGYGDGHGVVSGSDAPELGEEDIWSTGDDMMPPGGSGAADDPQGEWAPLAASGGVGVGMGMGIGGGGLGIPDVGRRAGGLSLALMDSGAGASPRIVHQPRGSEAAAAAPAPSPRGRQLASSAPVNVPDWSKIYRADSAGSPQDSDDTFDDGGGDAEMMPPHEYLARAYARNRKGAAATSVFEGVGRTLKGREMRRIRDAVWSRTGFDG